MDYRIEQLRYLLREDPSSRVFYQLAEVLRKQGQVAEAVDALHEGLRHNPQYVAAWVSLGRAHLAQGDLPQAERAFERALELDPQNAVAAKMIGEAALAQEDWTRAARAFRLAHELAPADDTVGERLEVAEERLAAIAAPSAPAARRAPPPVVRVSGEEPFTVPGHGDTGVWQSTQEVFAAMSGPAPAPDSAPESAPAPSDEEPDGFPHEVETAFAAPPEPPPDGGEVPPAHDEAPEPDRDARGPEPSTAPGWGSGLSVADVASSLEAGPPPVRASEEPLPEPPVAGEPEAEEPEGRDERAFAAGFAVLEAGFDEDAWEDDEDGGDEELDEEELAGELPLPTMTLARLAADQGDLELAERTLESLLGGDPAHPGADDLLNAVRARRRAAVTNAPAAAALRLWLEGIRLAAERLSR